MTFKATNDGKVDPRLLVVVVAATLSPDRVAECMTAPSRVRWTPLSPGRPSQRGCGGQPEGMGAGLATLTWCSGCRAGGSLVVTQCQGWAPFET